MCAVLIQFVVNKMLSKITGTCHFVKQSVPKVKSTLSLNRMSDAIGSGMPGLSGAGAILSGVMPYPTPHVPPFPTPTLVQPVAQLRQPYIVTLTNQVHIFVFMYHSDSILKLKTTPKMPHFLR